MTLCRAVAFAFIVGCSMGAAPEPARTFTIQDAAWLAGSWSGEHDGGTLEEHWTAPSGGTMSGMSRLVIGEGAVFHEYLRIVTTEDGSVVYMAQPAGRCPPTPFRLTRASATELVFENPEHDFPQRIRYMLEGGATLVAIVDGEEHGQTKAHESRYTRSTLTK